MYPLRRNSNSIFFAFVVLLGGILVATSSFSQTNSKPKALSVNYEGEFQNLFRFCDGEHPEKQQTIFLDSSQVSIVEYDSATQLLYFNTYNEIALQSDLHLKSASKGLVFEVNKKKAQALIRLYSMGAHKLKLSVLLSSWDEMHFCQRDRRLRIIKAKLLKASVVDSEKNEIISVQSALGRSFQAHEKHRTQTYLGKSNPKVLIRIKGALSATKKEEIVLSVRKPLYACYQKALEKNRRFQGTIVFHFSGKEERIIDSSSNALFASCVNKIVKKRIKEEEIPHVSIRTVFRLYEKIEKGKGRK